MSKRRKKLKKLTLKAVMDHVRKGTAPLVGLVEDMRRLVENPPR